MFYSMEKFTAIKGNYLYRCKEAYHSSDELVIYGAGGVGHYLYKFLEKNNIKIDSFCITGHTEMIDYETGLHIYPIEHFINDGKTYTFLVGVSSEHNDEIVNILKEHNISSYIEIDKYTDKIVKDYFFRPVLEVTLKIGCSINCRFCPQKLLINKYNNLPYKPFEMDFNTFRSCIDKMPSDTIIFFAGFVEPFLCKDAIKMMRYAREKGHDVTLATTLVGFSKDDFHDIKNILTDSNGGFNELVLHVPDENHLANINIDDEYIELLSLFLNETNSRGQHLVSSVSAQSKPEKRIFKILKEMNVRTSWELHDRAGNLDDSSLQSFPTKHGKIICERSLNLNYNVLLPNGDVVLCSMDYGLDYKLGNLLENSYEEIMASDAVRKMKSAMYSDDQHIICRECIFSTNL